MESAAVCLRTRKGLSVITVDNNGNPAFCGALLYAKYQKLNKVKKLIALGDLVEAKEKLEPTSNLGHYIFVNEDGKVDKRLQERVCISKKRDCRYVMGEMLQEPESDYATRFYKKWNPEIVYLSEGVKCLYIFDAEQKTWETYGPDLKTGHLTQLHIDYERWAKNLEDREDISSLTQEEKENIKKMF